MGTGLGAFPGLPEEEKNNRGSYVAFLQCGIKIAELCYLPTTWRAVFYSSCKSQELALKHTRKYSRPSVELLAENRPAYPTEDSNKKFRTPHKYFLLVERHKQIYYLPNDKYLYCDFHFFLADFKGHTHPLSGKIPLKKMKIVCRRPLTVLTISTIHQETVFV